MNKFVGVLTLLGATCVCLGWVDAEFSGWEDAIQYSPFIIIVRCSECPESPRLINGIISENPHRGLTYTDVKILMTLKADSGRASAGSSFPDGMAATLKPGNSLTLRSAFRPCQGDDYLLFATDFQGTNCSALSDYRVVPLGHSFNTNSLKGQDLEQQVKFMLQYRLNNLNQELQRSQEEKERLEKGVRTAR